MVAMKNRRITYVEFDIYFKNIYKNQNCAESISKQNSK
jgi:hypothetical protein